jgi:hypothetical protein
MERERELTFNIRLDGLEKLKSDLESLIQTLQSLLPSVPAPPMGWSVTPSGIAVPPSATALPSSLPVAQQAHALGMQATQQNRPPTPPPNPAQTIHHASQPFAQAAQQIAQATQSAQQAHQQAQQAQQQAQQAQQQAQQAQQQAQQQQTISMSNPTMQLTPPPPDLYERVIEMLQNIANIGYAGGRMGLGTWAMGQVASGLAAALKAIPALGLALNPATMAAAAAMFLISPSINAVGRNIGAEMMAGVTGQGGTTPSSIFYDAITANPIFRVLSWIPFFGPLMEAAVQGHARFLRAYESQLIAALITRQQPLMALPLAGMGGTLGIMGMGVDLLGFSPYYSAVELQRAADLMLRGFRFQQGFEVRGGLVPEFGTRTLRGELDFFTLSDDERPSLLQSPTGMRLRRHRIGAEIDIPELRGYRYIERLLDTGYVPETPIVTPTAVGRAFPRMPANILEFTGMLRHTLLRRFPMFGGVVNPIVEQVLDELVTAVNTPVMMQLFGSGAVNRWDYALMMLALQGDPRLVSLQFANAPDGRSLRDIAWEMFYLQRGQQLAGIETARAQIQLAQAQRFGTIRDTTAAFMRLYETTETEARLINQRIANIRAYAPALMDTPEFRQLLVTAEQLALRLREIAVSMAQFRVQVTETTSALATVQAEYGLVIARRGTADTVGSAMLTRAETLVRTTDARIEALRQLQAQVGEVEAMQIETQIQQLELQRIAGLESMATPPPTQDWLRRRAATQAILTTAQTTFAQFADIRALYESLMRQTGERLRAMATHRERMRERGLWTEEMETRWRMEAMQQVIELAQYQQAYENRWLDRLVSQVWNAPARMDAVAAWFTRREASLFYDIVPWAFGGTRERAQWMRETVPMMYRTLIGRLGTQEGFIETAMAALMAGAQNAFSGDLRIQIVVEDSGNRLIDAQQVHLNLNNQTRAVESVTVTVPVPTQ